MPPRPSPLALFSLALLTLTLAVALLAASAVLGLQRLDLVHAAVFNACAMRSYNLHWQHPQRLPRSLNYEFVKSPDSFVLVEIWVQGGPTLSFSHRLPSRCQ